MFTEITELGELECTYMCVIIETVCTGRIMLRLIV